MTPAQSDALRALLGEYVKGVHRNAQYAALAEGSPSQQAAYRDAEKLGNQLGDMIDDLTDKDPT